MEVAIHADGLCPVCLQRQLAAAQKEIEELKAALDKCLPFVGMEKKR
jgi:hypothetical protein